MPHPASRLWRVVRSRAWLLVLPIFLTIDFLAIPIGSGQWSRLKHELVHPRPATSHGSRLMGRPHITEDGVEWLWPWDEGYNKAEPNGSPWQDVTVFVDMLRRTGDYHITQESREVKVFGAELTPSQMADLHATLVKELSTEPEVAATGYAEPILEMLETGGWSYRRRVPAGHALDVAALALAASWVVLLILHAGALVLRFARWGNEPAHRAERAP